MALFAITFEAIDTKDIRGSLLTSRCALSTMSSAAKEKPTSTNAPAFEITGRMVSPSLNRCIDHVKRLVVDLKFDIELGAEIFQDLYDSRVWYRKKIIRTAFEELKDGRGCQNMAVPTWADIQMYCWEFIEKNASEDIDVESIQNMQGMWLRKSVIRTCLHEYKSAGKSSTTPIMSAPAAASIVTPIMSAPAAASVVSSAKRTVVISLDVEADGPAPSVNSCLMLGFIVVFADADPLGKEGKEHRAEWIAEEKEWCLAPQHGCAPDARTMDEFWSKNLGVLNYIKAHAVDAATAMSEFAGWYQHLLDTYEIQAWVCAPAAFDWQWLNVLYHRYAPAKRPALPYTARCMSSMKSVYRHDLGFVLKDTKPKELQHTHNATDDAREQAYEYLRTKRELAYLKEGLDRLRVLVSVLPV